MSIFISLDVETFGPIPGVNAMVELGAAAYNIEGNVVGTYQATLAEPRWTKRYPAAMKWWHLPKQYPTFKRLTTVDVEDPEKAMVSFSEWAQVSGRRNPWLTQRPLTTCSSIGI